MANNRISMSEALSTLSSMFPSFDEQTLKSTLYKTNGHMERTIELLLQLQDEGVTGISVSQLTMQQASSSGPRHNLPDDFLRYDDEDYRGSSGYSQTKSDEELARELQRQMILEDRQARYDPRQSGGSRQNTQYNPHVGRMPSHGMGVKRPSSTAPQPSGIESLSECM
jgi:hypothetical protein